MAMKKKLCLFHCSPFLTDFLTLLLPSQVPCPTDLSAFFTKSQLLPLLLLSTFPCPSALFYVFSLSSKSSLSSMSQRCWVRGNIIPTHSLSTDQFFPHSQGAHNPIFLLDCHQPGPNSVPGSHSYSSPLSTQSKLLLLLVNCHLSSPQLSSPSKPLSSSMLPAWIHVYQSMSFHRTVMGSN